MSAAVLKGVMMSDQKDKEIIWYKSTLVTLLTLARARSPNLTHEEIVKICEHTLSKYK